MNDRWLAPGEPGRGDPAAQGRGGTPKSEKRRRAGPPATLHQSIEQAFDASEDTGKSLRQQAHPIRVLKQRYGLSNNYAALVAAELRWEGVCYA